MLKTDRTNIPSESVRRFRECVKADRSAAVGLAGAGGVSTGGADAITSVAGGLGGAALAAHDVAISTITGAGADAVAILEADVVTADLRAGGAGGAVALAGAGTVAPFAAVSVASTLSTRRGGAAITDCGTRAVAVAGGDGITRCLPETGFELAVALAGAQAVFASDAIEGAAILSASAGQATIRSCGADAVSPCGGELVTGAFCRRRGNAAVALAGAQAGPKDFAQSIAADPVSDPASADAARDRGLVGDAGLEAALDRKVAFYRRWHRHIRGRHVTEVAAIRDQHVEVGRAVRVTTTH